MEPTRALQGIQERRYRSSASGRWNGAPTETKDMSHTFPLKPINEVLQRTSTPSKRSRSYAVKAFLGKFSLELNKVAFTQSYSDTRDSWSKWLCFERARLGRVTPVPRPRRQIIVTTGKGQVDENIDATQELVRS